MTSTGLVAPAEPLEVQLCDGVRVARGGEELDLSKTARQGRLVLAFLVLHPDRVVTRGDLMERLWVEPDPARVGASLSQTLSRLRHVLGRDCLERLPGGAVRLRGPVRVDVTYARELLEDGRLAVARSEWTSACEAAKRALALLGGQVLPADEVDWLEDVRRDVDEVRVEALELRATAGLRLGAYDDALAAARSAVDMSGARETAWALLMQAQSLRGEASLASQTFDELRRRLRDELGLTPSRELIELHRRIVAGELTGDVTTTSSSGRVPLPPALSTISADGPFVGRDDSLHRLREHYAEAQQGRRQFVVLCGEPGIGKTRLAGEFAREAYDCDANVLYGRSDPETLVPYQPFVTAIGTCVTEWRNRGLARELEPELSELSRLIPGLRRMFLGLPEPPAVVPEVQRYRQFNAVSNLLAFLAGDRPAVLILDDLQWADASTAVLLQHVLQDVQDLKLLVLGTLRDGDRCRAEQLADLLARPQRGLELLSLRGLDAPETAAFVRESGPPAVSERAVDLLVTATGGNPLLLHETLKSLAESECLDGVSEDAVRRVGVPEGAKKLIGRRLQHLTATTQLVLAVASVVGAEFDVRVVTAVTEEDETLDAVDEALAAGLLREVPDAVDRYVFSHALVRDALRERLSGARRRRLHHRIGEALEALRALPSVHSAEAAPAVHPAELAHHFFNSHDPEDVDKALKYSLEAGHSATESLAHDDASGHFRRALQLIAPGDDRRRCEIVVKLGVVELRQGSPEARPLFKQASELAARHGWPDLMAQAALGFASRYTEAGVIDDDGIALLRRARTAVGDERSALRAQLSARLADSLHFAPKPGEAERLSDEALSVAREAGDPHTLAAALESRHAALLSVEHLDERLRLSQELIELAREIGEREVMALGHHWRIYDLLEADAAAEAVSHRKALDALAAELRQPLYEHFSAGWEVVWALMAGSVEGVEAVAERFRELGLRGQARDTETIYRAQLVALRRREERLSEFVSTVQLAATADPALLAWRAVLPLAHLAAGDPVAATAEFEWFAHDDFSRVRHDMFWFTTMCVLAETCALLRDGPRARVLYDLLKPFEQRNVQVTQAVCWGSAERFLGLLAAVQGDWEKGLAHLESAIAKNTAAGNRASASLVRRDLANLLGARGTPGDFDRAAALLHESLEAARDARADVLVARIEAEIAAVGRQRQARVATLTGPGDR